MKKNIKNVLLAIVICFLIVGVPFIINELYKIDKGYITLWGASEVLSYYGTILGATATILAVIFTIQFTKRQSRYEYYILQEKLKWEKVDDLLQEHFKKIMSTEIIQLYSMSEKIVNPIPYIEKLQVRIIEIKTSLDWIKSYLNPEQYKNISDFIDEILDVDKEICNICSKIVESLMQFKRNEIYEKNYKKIEKGELIFSTEELEKYEKEVLNIPYTKPEEILNNIDIYSKNLLDIQEKKFQNLLNCKREIFNKIYDDLNNNN